MTKIVKAFVFLLAIVLVVQCDREQSVEAEGDGNPLQELNILSFDALPAEIQSKIITAETELKATVTHHKALKPFGSPKFNTIHQRLGDNGSQSYTLGLEKTNEGLYYDNLVINQDAEGNTRTHIIRYQPESSWYHKHKTEGLGYPHYSGAIDIFSESGTLLSSVTLASGRPVQKTTQDDTHVGHRANDQEMTCEVIDIEYIGGCAGEECWWSEIIITLNCTGAGGGGSDGMYDDGGYGQGGANGPQHEGGQHGGGGGGSPVNTVPVEEDEPPVAEENMDDQIIIDTTFVDTKAECIYNKLKTLSGGFANAIKKFDGEFPVAHLKFSMDDLDDNKRGRTLPPQNSIIEIQLNDDNSISGTDYRPNLLTAKTIIHEVIHAELFRKMLSIFNNGGNFDGLTDQDINTAFENGDYPGMLDYYTRYGINGFQHQQMAAHYRETIGRVLQEFDTGIAVPNHQMPEQLYMDLAWEGLNHSTITAWQEALSQEERDRIDQVIADYIAQHNNETCQE